MPLRKKKLQGGVYQRDARIDGTLAELLELSNEAKLERCSIRERTNPGYVPTECLLYLFRAERGKVPGTYLETVFRLLQERVLRRFARAATAQDTLTISSIREKVYGAFIELLARDCQDYEEKLDYFEVRFDHAVACLRRDAQEKFWAEEGRRARLEIDEESGEFTREVQEALGLFDPFSPSKLEHFDYRSALDQAIDALTPEQRRIVEMIRQEIPIDSKDPATVTICKVLCRSERTVRIHRDRAFARLKVLLEAGGRR